ncbi:hypothetical protein [Streptomyces mirabilis]
MELLLSGLTPERVAMQLGMATTTVRGWRRSDPEFQRQVERAREQRELCARLAKQERRKQREQRGAQVVGRSLGLAVTVRAGASHSEKVKALYAELLRSVQQGGDGSSSSA